MNPELQQKLFDKYPKLFVQKDLPRTHSAMCWGIEAGDGWFNIIDSVCSVIENAVEYNKMPPVQFSQVKEKYGELRIYFDGGDERTDSIIDLATSISAKTCEYCGNVAEVRTKGWIRNVCSTCDQKRKDSRPTQFDRSEG